MNASVLLCFPLEDARMGTKYEQYIGVETYRV